MHLDPVRPNPGDLCMLFHDEILVCLRNLDVNDICMHGRRFATVGGKLDGELVSGNIFIDAPASAGVEERERVVFDAIRSVVFSDFYSEKSRSVIRIMTVAPHPWVTQRVTICSRLFGSGEDLPV